MSENPKPIFESMKDRFAAYMEYIRDTKRHGTEAGITVPTVLPLGKTLEEFTAIIGTLPESNVRRLDEKLAAGSGKVTAQEVKEWTERIANIKNRHREP